MSGKKGHKCPYAECYLPDNNRKYWVQLVYLLVSILLLVKNPKECTFFSLLMFTAPILIDLASTELRGKLFKAIQIVFLVINVALIAFCAAGLGGLFLDNRKNFYIRSTAMLLPGQIIDKRFFLIPMFLDLLVPAVMFYACPSKKVKEIIMFGQKQRKEGQE